MNRRPYSDLEILLKAVAADGGSNAVMMADYRNICIDVLQVGFTGVVKFVGSNSEAKPDFTAAASLANPWTYIKTINLIDGSAVNGATGVSGSATTSVTMLEANTNGIRWFGCIVSSYAAGALTVETRGYGNI